MACESSPLGIRQGKVISIEFRIPIEQAFDSSQERSIALDSLILSENQPGKNRPDRPSKATVTYIRECVLGEGVSIALDLRYDVHFVSSQPCQLPQIGAQLRVFAEAQLAKGVNDGSHHPLPSHPLYHSFKFVHKNLIDL
jgi:hypothetical protein